MWGSQNFILYLVLTNVLKSGMGVASLKLRGGGNFLKLMYSAVFNDGKKLEG